ncbi:hypothetical protein Tco_1309235 [Tanacetum coccineum]
MVANLEKIEHNQDFYQIVDFLRASHIRYALEVRPTIHVSHIKQFWSTARTETVNGETNIVATIDGRQRTITEASIRRFIQLNDARGQFSHQWKFLIHTIMQCISPKSTGFNEFSSNIATAIVCFATNRTYNLSKMILDGMTSNIKRKSGKFLMYPRFLELLLNMSESAIRVAQSKALSPGADEPASLQRDVSHGEAFPTVSSLDAGQDRGNVAKTSAMPHDSPPRVTSLGGDEGSKNYGSKDSGSSLGDYTVES